jgi:asparagine synthase (glutamine-hydrolysing)
MCGIAAIVGQDWTDWQVNAMVCSMRHRGPDHSGMLIDREARVALGHNRLSILDLSPKGSQPMQNAAGSLAIVFNGEIYNYRELRQELSSHVFRSQTDTEVILAAYEKWGIACLDRLIGMFAFAIWDSTDRKLFAARDRFGVKPMFYRFGRNGTCFLASEVKALHASGHPRRPDPTTWSTYLTHGQSDGTEQTFWQGVHSLPAGHYLVWQDDRTRISQWYDVSRAIGTEYDMRDPVEVLESYKALLDESVKLRFRSDVPVGINLSGGVDSSTLLACVDQNEEAADTRAYTFVTGDPRYDELPWVCEMVSRTQHPLVVCSLGVNEVPDLALEVQRFADEPYGGLPTLAYSKIFETARQQGTTVLLDGQGMDEQWAGYDYYASNSDSSSARLVQGSPDNPLRPGVLTEEFRNASEPIEFEKPFPDTLRNLQYRDIRYTKLPRALRFNDRISMKSSVELREPFLDHRLVEMALAQPRVRKIGNGVTKRFLRLIAADLLPSSIRTAPKRALQTPQREWLRGPLRHWAEERIRDCGNGWGQGWFNAARVAQEWEEFLQGRSSNSFYVWQWISLSLVQEAAGDERCNRCA